MVIFIVGSFLTIHKCCCVFMPSVGGEIQMVQGKIDTESSKSISLASLSTFRVPCASTLLSSACPYLSG